MFCGQGQHVRADGWRRLLWTRRKVHGRDHDCFSRLRGIPNCGHCADASARKASATKWGWEWIIDFQPAVSIMSVAWLQINGFTGNQGHVSKTHVVMQCHFLEIKPHWISQHVLPRQYVQDPVVNNTNQVWFVHNGAEIVCDSVWALLKRRTIFLSQWQHKPYLLSLFWLILTPPPPRIF